MTNNKNYTADNIRVLKGIEGLRHRPAMYIGDVTTHDGLFTILREVFDNGMDEHLAGYATHIKVVLNPDGSVTVSDNGRGIPVDIHPTEGISAAEVIMTTLHAGGKFDQNSYEVSGGLHGIGVTATTALSEWLELSINRDGGEWTARFERGICVRHIEKVRTRPKNTTGTTITFKPDAEIFSIVEYDYDTLQRHFRQAAFLNPGVYISLSDNRSSQKSDDFHYDGGISEFVKFTDNSSKPLVRQPIYITGTRDKMKCEVAIQWSEDKYGETLLSFTNNIRQDDGGTHASGFRGGLSRAVLKYIKDNNLAKKIEVTADDVKEGVTAIVSVKIPEPKFSSQTKDKLVSSEVKPAVESIVYDGLVEWFGRNPRIAKSISDKVVNAATARVKSREARDLVRRKTELDQQSFTLPGKLSDCQSNRPSECELIVLEGESAGGSGKQGRDRKFQAILPIKGKILNIEKATEAKMLANEEVRSLITALGCGLGNTFDITKLRYHKIIIMADADVDGSHIRTLLMTFFYRMMPEIITGGYLYIAQPPLYRVKHKGKDIYLKNDAALAEFRRKNPNIEYSRFKGLGEMNPDQLWDTTLNPETRDILRVKIDNVEEAEEYFTHLMGSRVEPRKWFIQDNANNAHIDI